jgi:O-methyltransferase involved in polyketide biosynthesis
VLPGVSKTAILTLRARADEHRRADRAFEDPKAVDWYQKTAWPPELDHWYRRPMNVFLALRAVEIDRIVAAWANSVTRPAIVELGCGLSTRFDRMKGLNASRWIDLDLPEVIAHRETLDDWSVAAHHEHLARSVLDRGWMEALSDLDPSRTCIIAEGLLYYLPRPEVDALFRDLALRFPGAVIAFDILGAYDFQITKKNAISAGTEILWMIDPPFERVFDWLRLDVVPGFEPRAMMHRAIDLYWPRFGAFQHWAFKKLAGIDFLAGKRSGTVFARLRG